MLGLFIVKLIYAWSVYCKVAGYDTLYQNFSRNYVFIKCWSNFLRYLLLDSFMRGIGGKDKGDSFTCVKHDRYSVFL